MAEQEQITINFETLFELLRREKNREELQSLPETFYDDVANYLKEKIDFIEKTRNDIFSADATRAKENELLNIRKLIKDLYDKREKKILTLALDKSRTKSHLIDTSHLLKDELEFFNLIAGILGNNRDSIIRNIFDGKLPSKIAVVKNKSQEAINNEPQNIVNHPKPIRLIRFLNSVPKFVGPELEEYGPFEKEDMANLPSEIAEVLISKGRAEEMMGS